MRNTHIIALVVSSISLAACGGGGSETPAPAPAPVPQQAAPPPAPVPEAKPTKAEAFVEIRERFDDESYNNFSRFDLLGNDTMILGYVHGLGDSTITLVDYSDTANIVYTELGNSSQYRGVVKADFDFDAKQDIYMFSHGYEFVHDDGSVEMNNDGDNYFIKGTGTKELVASGDYTHGACAGDFNGDGNPDIFDVNAFYDNHPIVRYGNGNGNFDAVTVTDDYGNKEYIVCTSADVNQDGYDDVILGSGNGLLKLDQPGAVGHIILFGSSTTLEMIYDSAISDLAYDEATWGEREPATIGVFATGDYIIAVMTDYDIKTRIQLFERNGMSYTFVDDALVDETKIDIETFGDSVVLTNTWIWSMQDYYTQPATHISVVDSKLHIESKLREQ